MLKDWRKNYKKNIVTAQEALQHVQSGNRIAVGNACGEPTTLVNALVERANALENVEIVHMVAMGESLYAQPGMEKSFRHNSLFVGGSTRKAVAENRADFTPMFLSETPRLFKENILPLDVALINITPPDEQGFCSYGVSADYTVAAAECAKIVIAQINRKMPRTAGAKIHLDKLDYIVEKDAPLIELPPPIIGETEVKIGEHIASLVADGATVQMGIGAIPDAILPFLKSKKDLGIHTEMFSDGIVELAESGAITNAKKKIDTGKSVANFIMGTRRVYDFVDNNPDIMLLPCDYTNDPYIIGQNDNVVSINSALQIDLQGQVNAEAIGLRQFSGTGGQVDFIRGAGRSVGGKSIIAMPATASGGKISRIVCVFEKGTVITTSRNDVHYVVTEYGIADLRGKSIRQRTHLLISIAHPDFRESLENEAKQLGII